MADLVFLDLHSSILVLSSSESFCLELASGAAGVAAQERADDDAHYKAENPPAFALRK